METVNSKLIPAYHLSSQNGKSRQRGGGSPAATATTSAVFFATGAGTNRAAPRASARKAKEKIFMPLLWHCRQLWHFRGYLRLDYQ